MTLREVRGQGPAIDTLTRAITSGKVHHAYRFEGPDGVGYILKSGDALGNGRVTGITGTSVTFAVSAQPGQGPTTVTLRLVLD